MALQVVIIADDLTGALDAAAPFAGRRLRTVAVTRPDGLDAALASDAAVIAVSTGSREIDPDEAAQRCNGVARRLAGASPALVLKKIDSRLKGHLEHEIGAVMTALGQDALVVAPAIPDQGRIVRDGAVRGFGAETPLSVRERLGVLGPRAHVPDTCDMTAMRSLVSGIARRQPPPLLAGARGLAEALAAELTGLASTRAGVPVDTALVAIGSTDPITRGQLDRLLAHAPDIRLVHAPNGVASEDEGDDAAPVTVMATAPGDERLPPAVVAERFASSLARHVGHRRPRLVVCSGGETASALAYRLGITWMEVRGEVLPGLPVCDAAADGHSFVLVTKSGGLGTPDTFCRLLGREMPPVEGRS